MSIDPSNTPPPAPVSEGVLAWRVSNLEADVREIRTTTVTHTEFGLRLGVLETMVKEIRDGLANSRTRVMTHLVLPLISGVLVALVVTFVIARPSK